LVVNGNSKNVERMFAELRLKFVANLATRLEEMKSAFADIASQATEGRNAQGVEFLRASAHKLAGTAGTYGFHSLGKTARTLETACDTFLAGGFDSPNDALETVETLLAEIEAKATAAVSAPDRQLPPPTPSMPVAPMAPADEERTVILVDDDGELTELLRIQLSNFGFRVRVLPSPSELEGVIAEQSSAIVVMDIMFGSDREAGLHVVRDLRNRDKLPFPVVFLSARDDFHARVEAVRGGGDSYITKPIDVIELIDVLDRLFARVRASSFRIFIVDDDVDLAEYHTSLFQNAGFLTATETNPALVLQGLTTFRPDVVVMDIDMPECSGIELASVIRQMEDWFFRVPIVFLTARQSEKYRLLAVRSGGDDLFTKPANPELLIASVLARAERSRAMSLVAAQREANEERFGSVARAASEAIISVNQEGVLIFWNAAAEEIFGCEERTVLGRTLEFLVPERYRAALAEAFSRIASKGLGDLRGKPFESEALRKDGTEFPVEVSLAEWSLAGKAFVTGIIRDITERKKAEAMLLASRQELAQKSALLQTTLDAIDQGFVVWNTEHQLIAWNEKCRSLWYDPRGIRNGMPMLELLRHIAEKGGFGPGDPDQLAGREFERVIAAGGDSEDEFETLDSRRIWVRRFPVPMGGHAAIYTDISEIRRTENQLRSAKEEAEVANRAKSEFLSNMSHELRTPLNAVLGFAQILQFSKEHPLSDRQIDQVRHIIDGGTHLLELINEILDLARIESGKIELTIEDVRARTVLDECLLLTHAMAENRGIEIVVGKGFETTLEIRTDHTRFKQSLLNLISNAVKYNRENGKISLDCHETAGRMLHISVTDTGQGISADVLGELFQPFNRLGGESSQIEGTGIGLTITKQLVEMMGGHIGVDSEVGTGSTFWFELPLAEGKKRDDTVADRDMPSEAPDVAGTVLCVEDNPANLRLMEMIIENIEGLSMISAQNAELGIELAENNAPDLILLDINLPDIDGFMALEKLQGSKKAKDIPVIALSANAMPRDIQKGLDAGFDDYLTKPINVEEVVGAIKGILEK
jgi:PAS domain S-box-containing protein